MISGHNTIIYSDNNNTIKSTIFKFVDTFLKDTDFADISEKKIRIQTESGEWVTIIAVKRRKYQGNIYKLETELGYTYFGLKSSLKSYSNKLIQRYIGNNIALSFPTMIQTNSICIYDKIFSFSYEFGYIIGVYLSAGDVLENSIRLIGFNNRVKEYANILKLQYFTVQYPEKGKPDEIHITMNGFTEFIQNNCGISTSMKHIPHFAYNSSDDFLKGIIFGYIYDNQVIKYNLCNAEIRSLYPSVLLGLQYIFSYFNISSVIKKQNNYSFLELTSSFQKIIQEKNTEKKIYRQDNVIFEQMLKHKSYLYSIITEKDTFCLSNGIIIQNP